MAILEIVGITLSIFVFAFLSFWLPSYLKKWASNLADKQDIGDITAEIELAKKTFTDETEKLKSRLQLALGLQTSIASEERLSIIDLNEKYFAWLKLLTDASFGGLNENSKDEVNQYRNLINSAFHAISSSKAKFNLFVNDVNFNKSIDDLIILTQLNLAQLVQMYLVDRIVENDKISALRLIGNKPDEILDILRERETHFSKFLDERNKGYAVLEKSIDNFQTLSRTYIYKLLNSLD